MRLTFSFLPLIALLPLFVQADIETIVRIKDTGQSNQHVDFKIEGVQGIVPMLEFKMTTFEDDTSTFKLVDTGNGMDHSDKGSGIGAFWVGLGKNRDANCHLERESPIPLHTEAEFGLKVNDPCYLLMPRAGGVKLVCTPNFTPTC